MIKQLLTGHIKKQLIARDGFTLLEVMVVILILGILSAIASPSWLAFLQRQRLNTAQSEVLQGMRTAQTRARRETTSWQFTIQENNDIVRWRVDARSNFNSASDVCNETTGWNSLDSRITLNADQTTFQSLGENCWQAWFTEKGRSGGRLGKVTLSAENLDNQSCVYVSTFLGAMRKDQDEGC
ncbi:type II secretion system protein [Euhalothece natronophila Z-M001]|uniref:Type II secretion system protein n=1 Tax=Euhalothece natronophila Z-M001 TaxID=522448 RepID=A0A5B8NHY4_9CHRO|nr:type II secretion system protein [Euhalothece natronophila]QDZ38497.1 type II secretion system protein [Euhalothece natronophila Z-M001]